MSYTEVFRNYLRAPKLESCFRQEQICYLKIQMMMETWMIKWKKLLVQTTNELSQTTNRNQLLMQVNIIISYLHQLFKSLEDYLKAHQNILMLMVDKFLWKKANFQNEDQVSRSDKFKYQVQLIKKYSNNINNITLF